MTPSTKLPHFIASINKAKGIKPFKGCILALDPGETSGYTLITSDPEDFTPLKVHGIDQIKTWPETDAVTNLMKLLDGWRPDILVNESYRVYDWKSDDHKWSAVNTVQVIGCIWTLASMMGIPRVEQSAQVAKGFWTDERLQEFGVYERGKRHGRDATRHALYYLCFGSKKQ